MRVRVNVWARDNVKVVVGGRVRGEGWVGG